MLGVEHWIWLQQIFGYGSAKVAGVISRFGSAENFYYSYSKKPDDDLLTPAESGRINKIKLEDTIKIIEKCKNLGYDIITPDDNRYPERLQSISNPPAALYVNGNLPNMDDEVGISIVGPRKPSEYGKKAALSLAARLSMAGLLIISGGATGIDSFAHIGALATGGKTIAVLGCGLNYPYLNANKKLRENISENGALISEFPPDYRASKNTFPIRNRIISALSLGTVIIEAGFKSGALITARHAAEQGRDVFVIPGNPSAEHYKGSNLLIKDGAKPLLTAMDILEEYINIYPHKINLRNAFDIDDADLLQKLRSTLKTFYDAGKVKKDELKPCLKTEDKTGLNKRHDISLLTETAKILYNYIDTKIIQPDELAEISGLDGSQLLSAITELELFGILKAIPGGRYEFIE